MAERRRPGTPCSSKNHDRCGRGLSRFPGLNFRFHIQHWFIQRAVREIFGSASITTSEKHILLIRRRSGRVIDNHEELYTSLVQELPQGTKIDVFDDLNLPEPGLDQWKVFHQSRIIIAPHGAGLSGILACDPDTVVIEILGEGKDFNVC